MEILITKKNVIFDSQILSTLMSCPRLTDFRFNMNLVSLGGKSRSLEMGSIVHHVLENYYKFIIEGKFRSTAIEHALILGKNYAKTDEVMNCTPEEIEWVFKTCEQYFEFYKNDHWVPLEVETVKGQLLYEDDDIRVMWKAKFDMLTDTNQGIYPVDHKTMSQRRDTLSLNNQFMGQCILSGTRMMFVNKVGFQKSLKPNEKFERVIMSYSQDRLHEWQMEILPYYAQLYLAYAEGQYWPPNYTHCENKYGFCQFKGVCSADRGMREEELRQAFVVGEPWDITNAEE